MKKTKICICIFAVILLLTGTFLCTNETEKTQLTSPVVSENVIETPKPISEETKAILEEKVTESPDVSTSPIATDEAEKHKEIKPFCTLSVVCDDVLKNMDSLLEGKETIIPADGIILPKVEVPLSEGESVFDVLLRVLREKGIHMEYSSAPMYNSVYIEGIGNLYEFDCGDTSGWTYSVNGESPMHGCSQHIVKQGDNIEFRYKCSLY